MLYGKKNIAGASRASVQAAGIALIYFSIAARRLATTIQRGGWMGWLVLVGPACRAGLGVQPVHVRSPARQAGPTGCPRHALCLAFPRDRRVYN